MTTFQELDWRSMDFFRQHLYKRVANPLDNALGRLLIAEHIVKDASTKQYLARVAQGLEVSLNLLKAWAVLVHVQNGQLIGQEQRRAIAHDGVPEWIKTHLSGRAPFHVAFTRPVWVHPETFYEALVLLCDVTMAVGKLKSIVLRDAADTTSSIWVRAIFEPAASGRYASLDNLISRLDVNKPDERDTAMQIEVLRTLFAINGAELRIQDNVQTGEQALAVQLPAVSASQIASTTTTEGHDANGTPAERAPDQQPAGETPATPPTVDSAVDTAADTSAAAAAGPERDGEATRTPPQPSSRAVVQDHLDAVVQGDAALKADQSVTPEQTAPGLKTDVGGDEGEDDRSKDDTLIVPPVDWRERMRGVGNVPSNDAKFLVSSAQLKRPDSPDMPSPQERSAEAENKPPVPDTARASAAQVGEGDSSTGDQQAAQPAASDPDAPVS